MTTNLYSKNSEKILCFKKGLLSNYLGTSQVFYDESLWSCILKNFILIPRSQAENDFRFKQLIVYVVIKYQNTYLTYKRTHKTQEKRLRGKYSIGIGGHVNVTDEVQLSLTKEERKDRKLSLLIRAIWREIDEEIEIKSRIISGPQLICFINDDSNVVGRLHFGSVWLMEIDRPKVLPKKEVGKIEFVTLSKLKMEKYSFLERWSQLLVKYLEKVEI